MTSDAIYRLLNESEEFDAARAGALKLYLISQVERYDRGEDNPEDIAYEIAGLLSALSVNPLPRSNPFMSVLDMANQLELPHPHRSAEASWEALRALIRQLPG